MRTVFIVLAAAALAGCAAQIKDAADDAYCKNMIANDRSRTYTDCRDRVSAGRGETLRIQTNQQINQPQK